jgi:dTDP-4-dehydrorhamnose 3,5-epimerase
MKFIEQSVSGVFVIEPKVWGDDRGYFMETWKKNLFQEHIGDIEFVQDNESKSDFGVLRGMHAQSGSSSQSKLVRCLQGVVMDVVVDARKNSPTFGQYVAVELSAENKRQLFVPKGFYHGFIVLSKTAVFSYKVDHLYDQTSEVSFHFSDPTIQIEWPLSAEELKLSDKDKQAPLWNDAYHFNL